MYLDWDITNHCNLSCTYCYNSNTLSDTNSALRLTSSQLYDLGKKLIDNDIDQVLIGGGEPLIVKDYLIEVIKVFSQLGIKTDVTTNGTLMDSFLALDLISAGLSSITFSLDSYLEDENDKTKGRGSYKRTLNGISIFHKACIETSSEEIPFISISTVLSGITIHSSLDIKGLFQIASDYEVDQIRMIFIESMGKGEQFDKKLSPKSRMQIVDWIGENAPFYPSLRVSLLSYGLVIDYLEKYYPSNNYHNSRVVCAGGCEYMCFLNHRLELWPCYGFADNELQNGKAEKYFDFNLENQNIQKIKKIKSNNFVMQFNKLKDKYLDNIPDICKECKYKEYCRGICRLHWLTRDIEKNRKIYLSTCEYIITNHLLEKRK